jgi:hypothetical protein
MPTDQQTGQQGLRGPEAAYLTLAAVARRFPPSRRGRPVHVGTVVRWITEGARLRDGTRLHLLATRLPGRWVVEPAALQEFLDRLTADRAAARTSAPPAYDPAPPRARSARKAAERAARELDNYGI